MARTVPLVIFISDGRSNPTKRLKIGDVEIGDTGLMTGEIRMALYIEDGDNVIEVDPMYLPLTKLGER